MIKIGIGYDAHRLVEDRPLILGGFEVPHEKGLLGHSDADVLSHAIMDALLGALNLGSIGDHFPDTDAEYKDISSRILLRKVRELVQDTHGYEISNVDSVVVAQRPKLKPYMASIRRCLAEDLQMTSDCVSVKATTTETMGFEGREEGISVQAVVLVQKK